MFLLPVWVSSSISFQQKSSFFQNLHTHSTHTFRNGIPLAELNIPVQCGNDRESEWFLNRYFMLSVISKQINWYYFNNWLKKITEENETKFNFIRLLCELINWRLCTMNTILEVTNKSNRSCTHYIVCMCQCCIYR